MNQCDRIKLILKENKLKQKQLAAEIGVSESYISMLLKKPEIRLSQSLATLKTKPLALALLGVIFVSHIPMETCILLISIHSVAYAACSFKYSFFFQFQ